MSEWKTVRLGDVCEILNGYAFKSDKYVDSGIRVIRITNVQKGFIEDNSPAFYPITEKKTLKDYELHENDLLISLTGNVGRVALLSKEMLPAALNQRVGCIRIRDKNLLISYLFTFLNSDKFESDCIYSARGIAQKNMSTEWLKNYLIPLPPIEVQIKIANNLNTCSKIIKKHNKQLNNFDLLIKSRFIEMFGDPVSNPMGWEVKKLGDMCSAIMNGTTPKGGEQVYVENGITFLRSQNVWRNKIDLEDVAYIDETTHKSMKKSSLKKYDILMTKTGRINTENSSLGRAALFMGEDDSANINGHVYLIRLEKEYNHEFVIKILTTPEYRDYIRSVCVGGIDKRQVNKDHIEDFPIIQPPKEKQEEFSAFVQQVDKSKFTVQKSLEKAETLYKSLMQQYFA